MADQEPPMTLAALRSRGARSRRTAPAEPQMGLLFSGEAEPGGAGDTSLVAGPRPMPPRSLPLPTPQTEAHTTATQHPKVRPVDHEAAHAPAWSVRPEPMAEYPVPSPATERRVWSVAELVGEVRSRVERAYGAVWVEGEISNCRAAGSGHVYLTLKDGDAQIAVALFRRQAQLLRFRPENGMAVLVRGRLSVYEGRGELQLIAETMEARGAGALLVAFEQLKARLRAEGLFDAARKRPLPAFPRTVGVVTSTAGAALHDVITVVRRRNARLNLLIFPALVQGSGCANSVIAGLRWFGQHPGMVDLILLTRGGGSAEDLCGFNEEALARAIAACPVPVVSAIGHETDVTIADFVADLRAPTPSAAAELMTEAQHRIEDRLAMLGRHLQRAAHMRLLQAQGRFVRVSADRVMERLHRGLERRGQRLDEIERRLERARAHLASARERRLDNLRRRLERQNPGWRLGWDRDRLQRTQSRLAQAAPALVARRRVVLERTAARLEALSPVAVLERGYALVYHLPVSGDGNASLITSATETAPGQRIRARLARGSVIAEVVATSAEVGEETGTA